MINISGAGVRGLSCALYLLNSGYEVTIYEIRQEIGNPVRSPGIIKHLPEEFLKKYWYIPAGGFVGVITLALGIRALVK